MKIPLSIQHNRGSLSVACISRAPGARNAMGSNLIVSVGFGRPKDCVFDDLLTSLTFEVMKA